MFSSRTDKSQGEGDDANRSLKLGVPTDGSPLDRTTSLDRVVIRGLFKLAEDGELQIGGEVEGDIKCYALTILPGGSMDGNVEAERILVEGSFTGNIETSDLVIATSARVVSDDILVHNNVVIEPEARFEGILRRPAKGAAERRDKPAAEASQQPASGKAAAKTAPKGVKAAAARKEDEAVKRGLPEDA